MRKALLFRSTSVLAGPERYVLQLARPIQEEGFQVELLAFYRRRVGMPATCPVLYEARRKGVSARQLNDTALFPSAVIAQVAEILKREEFPLLHTHDYKTNLLGSIAARLAGVGSVATVHLHTRSTYRLKLYRLLDLMTLRFFPKVIAVAESIRQELVAAGLPGNKVVTIHYGIDVQGFASDAHANNHRLREQLGIEGHQPIVSTIGRLSPQKRQGDFLEAARRVLDVFPETRFLVIGGGLRHEDLEALAASLGIDGAVSFLGHRRDVAAYMAVSDIIVMASVREGLPYVLLEALALAKPIVATRVGGVPELIWDGETGLLVPSKDPGRLTEAILYVLRHREEAARLGKRGRELVWQEFSPSTMAHKTAKVYREVLSRGQESQP